MPHFGIQGGPTTINGILHLPIFRDPWGHDIVGDHVRTYKIDVVLSFHDVWTLSPEFPQSFAGVPWITYSPVDSIPVPRRLQMILSEARYVLAMSRFGEREMSRAGIRSTYIPHAINTDIYCPGDKTAAREEMGVKDKFTVLIAAANYYYPSRKAFPEQMAAFAEFHKEFPDSQLLLHTALQPTTGQGGLDMNDLVLSLGLEDCTANTPEYDIAMGLSDGRMAQMYRCADVLLGASFAEGFGLMQMEAQACGVPIIVHDFGASPEYLFNGIKVPSSQPFWNLLGCWQAIPSIKGIYEALRELYLNRKCLQEGQRTYERVKAELSEPYVRDHYWKPFLNSIDQAGEMAMGRIV